MGRLLKPESMKFMTEWFPGAKACRWGTTDKRFIDLAMKVAAAK
jgi:hypothetical protein